MHLKTTQIFQNSICTMAADLNWCLRAPPRHMDKGHNNCHDSRRTPSGHRYGYCSTNLLLVSLSILLLSCCLVIKPSHQQSSISLNTAQWFVSNSNGSLVLPAQVPGGIYSDLRRNQVLKQEILYGKNDIAYRWVGHENWTYTTSFAIDQQIAMSQSVKLVLHGVDTIATVYMNGEEVGTTDNMFVRYKFDVKPHLRLAGLNNILAIRFESPIKYAAKRSHQSIRQNRGKVIPPYCPSPVQRGECHVNFIRKMQASFSWDWGPAFPSVGLYKNVELEYGSFGVIRDILVETRRLPPLVQPPRQPPQAPPQVIISSTIRHNVRVPTVVNRTVPYMRAPPYYMAPSGQESTLPLHNHMMLEQQSQRIEITQSSQQQLLEENWLLKITLVAEMAQPSFGYNVRVEFNLNGVLHYESEHINVVANSEGYIRLGFNLRIDNSRMQVRPWWPNNAGSQTLYKLTARMMPIPNPPDRMHPVDSLHSPAGAHQQPDRDLSQLQARAKPLQTPAVPPMIFLATAPDAASHSMQQLSEKDIWFGFRTVELIQEPITRGNLDDGLTFNFRVNGVDLFAMGSNWIPASVLPENSNDLEYVRYLLQSAKDANMNMMRVWGGGIYESDEFYRMADELGIMIWHDFMFACALYPVEDDFISSVRLEIEQQVQRLQHHPSIVLWAGNNENEMAIAGHWWPEVMVWNKKLRENYAKLYAETIRPIVQILDPTRPYVESSPSNGLMSESQAQGLSRYPNDNKYGDVHHYDYLTDSFDWTVYPSTRFASEYGFQSYPSFNALTSVTPPTDWKYPLTSNILHRQHRLTGETEMKLQMKLHFNELKAGGADKLKSFIYVSQLSQAIAIKTETEFYRRNRFIDPETKLGKTMGALYWQLNDVWAAPTWASIEYGGKWKMLHYFARRFFFPIQVMPYLVQPQSSISSALGNSIQQAISSSTSMLSSQGNRLPGTSSSTQQQQQPFPVDQNILQQQQAQQQQTLGGGPLFVLDLVRDDLFDLLDSFNVTIRFYRWTSFAPVWQDTVYVRNTRPQNVTRIYEQDTQRILRQPGVVSLSGGVFHIVIEQQPRLGLSQIENYLMPVAPNRITAMRVAKINVELVQGPFELQEVTRRSTNSPFLTGGASQWACAYRLTLVSDSIAMFVWLDLNFINSPAGVGTSPQQQQQQQQGQGQGQQSQHQQALQQHGNDFGPMPSESLDGQSSRPYNVHLDALPVINEQTDTRPAMAQMLPENIRIHLNEPQQQQRQSLPGTEIFETSASDRMEAKVEAPAAPLDPRHKVTLDAVSLALHKEEEVHHQHQDQDQSHPTTEVKQKKKRFVMEQAPDRLVLNIDNQSASADVPQVARNQHSSRQSQQGYTSKPRQQPPPPPPFRPVDASGGNLLRYQFSDNAFNMFEPSKVVDLYLSRCLSKTQVEVALEIQSLADSL